ncbi:unnamed protein product [Caenorhabditis sp. 36 PRJEB53466]|nr:unnamed protein product [Caenorhabditis sp. 36 PRJEB53466]
MIVFQILCAITSLCLNFILTFLILTKSPAKLGAYKYLMCYISLFEAFYSIWDLLTEPIVHSYKAAFVVLRDFKKSLFTFNREASFVLVCVYCGLFGFSLAIFGVHFIYRYGAVNKAFRDRYLPGRRVYVLFVVPMWYFVWWAVLCYIYFHFSTLTDDYMKESVAEHYGIPIKDFSYICVYFQPTGADGLPHPDPRIFFSIGCMWYMIISSMFCVFYFGSRCYWEISQSISTTAAVSAATKTLQSQLFHALVVQTFIPLVLMYIPIGILFFFPMVIWQLPFTTEFVGYTIAFYPAIDPLPNMIIIKCYRHVIIEWLIKVFFRLKPSETGEGQQHPVNAVDPQSLNGRTARTSMASVL